jgi:hypothetical protein
MLRGIGRPRPAAVRQLRAVGFGFSRGSLPDRAARSVVGDGYAQAIVI